MSRTEEQTQILTASQRH